MTNIYTNLFKGFLLKVHHPNEVPNMKSTALYLPVGFHTNIAMSKIKVRNVAS